MTALRMHNSFTKTRPDQICYYGGQVALGEGDRKETLTGALAFEQIAENCCGCSSSSARVAADRGPTGSRRSDRIKSDTWEHQDD
jgi:hypothetical protein